MINKEKNVGIQITLSKEVNNQLNVVVNAFNEKGFKCSKSLIIEQAIKEYIQRLVAISKMTEKAKEEKQDA